MNKLIVVIMGPGKEHFYKMCLDSVDGADEIIYSTSNKEWGAISPTIIHNCWDESDPNTNGKCRNEYLKYLKKNYPDDWALILDEDEIVEDLSKVKQFIKIVDPGIYNVKMRHLIGDLGHEDATRAVHVVPGRLFKISEAIKYPEHSHPILEGELMGACLDTVIWHIGHLPIEYMDYVLMRYKQHSADSIIHTQDFLKQWKYAHLLGKYPTKDVNTVELPKQLIDRYEIDTDMFYQSQYQIELKHPMMVNQWNDYFKPKSVLDLGCGRGCYLFFWKWFVNDYKGIELSKWAKDNSFASNIVVGNVDNKKHYSKADLITAIDVLEHLTFSELDLTLKNMSNHGNHFLFSIPFDGDPNLMNDSTHKQFKSKEEWIELIEKYGIKILDTPQDWAFAHQILVGVKK